MSEQQNDLEMMRKARLVNLGSGPSAYDFRYAEAGIPGFNFGMTPSCFPLEELLIRRYGGHLPMGCAAILTVCPFSFADNTDYARPERFIRYYGVLSAGELKTMPAHILPFEEKLLSTPERKWFPYELDLSALEKPISSETLINNTLQMMAGWKKEISLSDYQHPAQAKAHAAAISENITALEKLARTCTQLGLRPYLLLPPLYEGLRAQLSEAFFSAFVYQPISRLNTDLPLIDLTASPLFTAQHFAGPVFLNREGAIRLTRVIDQIVSG